MMNSQNMHDGAAMKKMLESPEFKRVVLEELAKNKVNPVMAAIELAVVYLVRQGVPRDRGNFVGVAYVCGLVEGLSIMSKKSGE